MYNYIIDNDKRFDNTQDAASISLITCLTTTGTIALMRYILR